MVKSGFWGDFPRFWGVVCIEKCFRNFEIVIGSAVSEMSPFARFYVGTKTINSTVGLFRLAWGPFSANVCNSPPVQPALFAFPRLCWPRSSPSPKIPPLTFLSEPTDLCETLLSGLAESKDRESRHLTPIGQGVRGAHLEHKCYIIQKTGFLATFGSLMIYYVKVGKRQKKGQQTWDRFVCYICRTLNKGSSCYYMVEIKPQVHLNWNWLRDVRQ